MPRLSLSLLAVLAGSSGFAARAGAVDADEVSTARNSAPAESEFLGEVIVTARFQQEDLQTTPVAITAVTGDALARLGIDNVSAIGREVPNVYLQQNGQQFGHSLTAYIRGVGQSDFDYAFEPGVAMYIDGVYFSTLLGSAFDLLDLERVEVLRGPQGTLSGRSAIGGSINLVSRKPRGDNSGSLEASTGDYHRLDIKGSFDVALIEDALFLRVTGMSKSRNGYQKQVDFTCAMNQQGTPQLAGSLPSAVGLRNDSCVTGTFGGDDVKGGRVALRALPATGLEINFALDYTKDNSSLPASSILGLGNVDYSTNPPTLTRNTVPGSTVGIPAVYQNWNSTVGIPNYGIPYDARFLTGNPYISYSTHTGTGGAPSGNVSFNRPLLDSWGESLTFDYDLAAATHAKLIVGQRAYNTFYAADSDLSPLPQGVTFGHLRYRGTSAELQLTGSLLDEALEWSTGVYYFGSHATEKTLDELNVYNFTINRDNVVDSDNESAFAHLVYHATSRLSFSGGVRYSRDSKSFLFDNGFIDERVHVGDSRPDWRVGIDYKLSDTLMVYTSVSTGYRPGSFNPRPYIASQFVPVSGENLIAYELGAKSSWLDNRLRLNTAVFHSDYKHRIIALSVFDTVNNVPDTQYVNGPAKIDGVEAELVAEPLPGLRLDGQVGYTRFKAPDISIGKLPGVPEINSSLGIEFERSLGKAGFLTPRLDWTYNSDITFLVGATALPPPPEDTQKGYSLFNGRLTWQSMSRDWSVALSATNLFNKFYWQTIQDWRTLGGTMTGEATPSQPREWAVTFKHKF